jgi:N-acetylneuraminate synthase/sialic acid synthase
MFATAFDIKSAYFLEKLDVPAYKVASGCLTDFPLLEAISTFNKPLIVSTGGWAYEYVDRTYRFLKNLNAHFCFLHCIASYPNRIEEMNLNVIGAMMDRYQDIIIGMSDHHPSVKTALFAYFCGARIIEKHFTLSRAWKGPDHAFSLEVKGMETLCEDLKDAKASLGKSSRNRLESEEKPIKKISKGIYAIRHIMKNERINHDDVAVKIPGNGLEPYHIGGIISKLAKVDILPDEPITASKLMNYTT